MSEKMYRAAVSILPMGYWIVAQHDAFAFVYDFGVVLYPFKLRFKLVGEVVVISLDKILFTVELLYYLKTDGVIPGKIAQHINAVIVGDYGVPVFDDAAAHLVYILKWTLVEM